MIDNQLIVNIDFLKKTVFFIKSLKKQENSLLKTENPVSELEKIHENNSILICNNHFHGVVCKKGPDFQEYAVGKKTMFST